ncbi:DHA2 family efflux MFS transporter permease subunit [Frankia sp. QA3]|uniref:DHA2 family efflux MFS transporter permease subunit n=1 Tax=Frankia sp. QA3 TaxID=710111 RepID=UPI000269BCDC|nr:DHA2 family efflux MFS transporter permease subunit [Frankia sp. QA3]EIV92265.1 drug resistance transporter, EmrB/QacA subfamily [Frankia sp. QA3]
MSVKEVPGSPAATAPVPAPVPAPGSAPAPAAGVRTGPALVALAGAALLAVLDGTVVAVALDPLADAFAAPLTTVVWVTIAYLLAAATALPLLGWATARFGGRTVFLTGLGLFLLGSLLCALARSPGMLIGFRVIQGFGGGLLEPTAMTLSAALATRESMGRVLSVMGTVVNVAPAGGPILGGLLLETGHWQWLFVVNIPLGLLVLAATLTYVPAGRPDPAAARPGADLRGLALLTAGYLGVLFAVNRAGEHAGDWPVLAAAAGGIVLLAAYVRHAFTTTATPALDLRLLRRPGFAASVAVMGLVGLVMYGQIAALPVIGLERHGLHGLDQGLLVCALGLGLLVSMTTGGRISDRLGARSLVRAGAAVTAVLLATFAASAEHLPLAAACALFVAVGLSFGLTASPTVASLYRTLPPTEQPQGTTSMFMTVQLAASLGVALLSLLHSRAGADWVAVLFALLAAAAAGIGLLAARLPGRPG